jgi:hypothetical protein
MTAKHASRQNQDVSDRDTQVFPFRAEAWIAGTMGLTFEERGFYIAIIAAMWSRKGPIPADQLAITLRCDPRQARRLLDRLIAHGKLTLDADNRVYNSHVMAKLQVTLEPATSGELPADFSEKSGRSPGEVREKSGNIFPPKLADTESVAAGEPEIGGLNGSTAAIVQGVARWLNNLVPDLETARRIVSTNTGIFGSDAVRRAFADMQADVLDGKVIASPIKAFAGYCDSAKRQRPQASQPRDFISEKQQRSAKAIADAKALLAAQGGIQ